MFADYSGVIKFLVDLNCEVLVTDVVGVVDIAVKIWAVNQQLILELYVLAILPQLILRNQLEEHAIAEIGGKLYLIGRLVNVTRVAGGLDKLFRNKVHQLNLFPEFHSFPPGLLEEVFILSDFIPQLLLHFVKLYLQRVHKAFQLSCLGVQLFNLLLKEFFLLIVHILGCFLQFLHYQELVRLVLEVPVVELLFKGVVGLVGFVVQLWPDLENEMIVVSYAGVLVLAFTFEIGVAELEVDTFISES